MEITKTVIQEINQRHASLGYSMKRVVDDAKKIGELLNKVKESVEHGSFVKWVEKNCKFSRMTANNYMRIYVYRDKCKNALHLQEAYKQIEMIEKQEKEKTAQTQKAKISYREKHNEKPDNWERADDYAWEKKKKEDQERTSRIEMAKRAMDKEKQKKKLSEEERDAIINEGLRAAEEMVTEERKYAKLTFGVDVQKDILAVIDGYLLNINEGNRQIEFLHNIIKYCRIKSAGLQKT